MAAEALFSVQIATQTRDIFTIWKIVPISHINHYRKTQLEYFIFSDIGYNLGKFVWANKNVLRICPKTEGDLNHCILA